METRVMPSTQGQENLVIPGYRIEHELGRGGMATVYKAVQEALDRPVALKVMSPALAADHSFTQRFLNEARTMAKMLHPNIITVFDVGVVGHYHYIAMEFVEDGDLKQRIRQEPIQPELAISITEKLAGALEYAHGMGIVHRDIKPENILFRKDGTPVLTDFGIARSVDSSTRLTQTGMSVGTPHYMSPEQARGEKVDGKADLYSLGVVLYEMLTGKVPFDAPDSVAIAVKHVTEAVPLLPEWLKQYQNLITILMNKNPSVRLNYSPCFGNLVCDKKQYIEGSQESLQGDYAGSDINQTYDVNLTALIILLMIIVPIFLYSL